MNKEIYSTSNKIAKSLHVFKIKFGYSSTITILSSVVIISMTGYIFLLHCATGFLRPPQFGDTWDGTSFL